jgi:surface protein
MSFIVDDLAINTIENTTRKIDLSGSGPSTPFNYYLVSFENGTVKNSSQTILNTSDSSFIAQQTAEFDVPYIYFTPELNFSGSSLLEYKIIYGGVSSNVGNINVETFNNIDVDEISPIAPDINIQIISQGNNSEIFNIDFNNVTSNFSTEYQQFYIFNIPYFRYDQNSETLFYPTYPGFLTDLSTSLIIDSSSTDISSNYVQYTWPGNSYFGSSQFSYFFQELSGNEFVSNVGIVTITFSYKKLNGCDTGSGPNPTRLWNRLTPVCPSGFTPQQLDERRKAEIFKYKKNSAGFSKKQQFSRLSRGLGKPRGKTYATQGYNVTNPNVQNLPLVGKNVPTVVDDGTGNFVTQDVFMGTTLVCPNSKKNFAFSWQNDVPGPSTKIALNTNVPLTRYQMPRTFQAGGTKWPQYGPLPYEIPPQFDFFSIPLPISPPFVLDLSFDYHSVVPFEIFLDGVINTNEPLTYQILTIPPDGSGVVLDSNFNKITSTPHVLPGNSFQIVFVPEFIPDGIDITDNTSFTYNAVSSSNITSNTGTVSINIDISNNIIGDYNIYQLVEQWITNRNAPQFSDKTYYPYFGEINTWNVSLVTDMSGLFRDRTTFGSDNKDQIYNWNVSNVTNITDMFNGATIFTGNLNTVNLDSYVAWDVSSITDLEGVFSSATNFDGNITDWDVKNVTNFTKTFYHTNKFNQPIGNWNLSSAQNLSNMFDGAVSFNKPLENWNVSNVTTMENMFLGAVSFNHPLENWSVSNVTTMENMFHGATDFYQSINIWDTTNVTNYNNMFFDTTAMIHEYTGYEGFGTTPLSSFFNIDAETFPFLKLTTSSSNITTGTAGSGEYIVYIKGGTYNLKPATTFSLYQLFLVGGGMDGAARAGGNGGQVIDKSYSTGMSITKLNIFDLHTGTHLDASAALYHANRISNTLYKITTPNTNDNTTGTITNTNILTVTAYSGNGAYGGAGWEGQGPTQDPFGPEGGPGTENTYTGLYYGGGGGRCKAAKVAGSPGGLGGGGGGGGSYEGQGTGAGNGYAGAAGGGIDATPGGAGGAAIITASNIPGNSGSNSIGGGGGGGGSNTAGFGPPFDQQPGGTGGTGTSPGGGTGGIGGPGSGNSRGASGGGGGGGTYSGGGGGAGGQGGGEGLAEAKGGEGATGIIIIVYKYP